MEAWHVVAPGLGAESARSGFSPAESPREGRELRRGDGIRRWVGWCAYDGAAFSGWQSQAHGGAVQDALEARLAVIFGHQVRVHGAGRTDAGVHARAMPFHFEADWKYDAAKLRRALRVQVPPGLSVRRLGLAPEGFHARYSALAKRYVYYYYEGWPLPWERNQVWGLGKRQLDESAMQRAADLLLGEHDFSAFGAQRGDGSVDDPVKKMHLMRVERHHHRLTFTTIGSGYLFKMVRSMAGVLARVGDGRLPVEAVGQILVSKQRTEAVETAPAGGLWLDRVFYRPPALAVALERGIG